MQLGNEGNARVRRLLLWVYRTGLRARHEVSGKRNPSSGFAPTLVILSVECSQFQLCCVVLGLVGGRLIADMLMELSGYVIVLEAC